MMRTVTVVMRNGASFNIQGIMNRSTPYMLQADTTTHPTWTGEKAGLSMEDERISRLLKRFDGFVATGTSTKPEGSEEETKQPAA